MAKVCTAWEGFEARQSIDLIAGADASLSTFAEALAADAASVQRLLERCRSGQVGCGASRVSEDLHSELARLAEKNKELRATLENTAERVQRNKETYHNYKQDQKLLSEEVKETYEAFLMAKKYYKKHLRFYYTLESTSENEQTVYVQFFTERRGDSQHFSIRLKRNVKTGRSELMEMTPTLATFKGIKNRLSETNDVPGALCCIRQSFLKIRQKKH